MSIIIVQNINNIKQKLKRRMIWLNPPLSLKRKTEIGKLFLNVLVKQFPHLKGCVRYILASLFFKLKREHLSNDEKYILFYFKSSFRFGENQILEF